MRIYRLTRDDDRESSILFSTCNASHHSAVRAVANRTEAIRPPLSDSKTIVTNDVAVASHGFVEPVGLACAFGESDATEDAVYAGVGNRDEGGLGRRPLAFCRARAGNEEVGDLGFRGRGLFDDRQLSFDLLESEQRIVLELPGVGVRAVAYGSLTQESVEYEACSTAFFVFQSGDRQ